MEDGEVLGPKARTTAQLWVYFGFKPNHKGEPSNVEEAICEISHKKVPVKSANATNLKRRLQKHHPQCHAQLFLDVQIVMNRCYS